MERLLKILIVFTFVSVSISVSQSQDTACLNQLIPCLQYINSTQTPPLSCCTPLKSLIKSDPSCLCNILSSNSMTKQAGVNTNQAVKLPQRCGQKVDVGLCNSSQKQRNSVTNSAGEFVVSKMVAIVLVLMLIETIWLLN